MAYDQSEKARFRSFAERYVIERASHWKPGEEDQGAWAAIQDAKRAYHLIALASDDVQARIAQAVEHAVGISNALQAGNATQQTVGLTTAPGSWTYTDAMHAMKKSLVDPGVPLTLKEQIARVLSKITP